MQKEYLQRLLMMMAEKEHVFETGAGRLPGLCSYSSIDWLGDMKLSLVFWAATSLSAERIVCTQHMWDERKIGKTFYTVRLWC